MNEPINSFLGKEEPPLYTPTNDEKTMGMLCHLLALFFFFLAPLIIYLVKKDQSKYIEEHAKESLNFQVTVMIAFVASGILIFARIGIALWAIFHIFRVIVGIVATIKSGEGMMYRYPFTLRLIK